MKKSRRLLSDLGKRVRTWRRTRGMSRSVLSRRSGVSERYLAELESGDGNISVVRLARVADAMDIPVSALLEDAPASADYAELRHLIRSLSQQQMSAAVSILRAGLVVPDAARPIALIGLRGAGKTTLGEQLAVHLGIPFVRLVLEAERMAGMSVSEIFSLSGDEGYRRLERRALQETLARNEMTVIEAGGSLVMDPDCYEELLSACFVVWLQATPEEHMQRVIDQGDLRPMANRDDAMSDLRRILQIRNRHYARAHGRVNTSGRSVTESLEALKAVTNSALASVRRGYEKGLSVL